MRLKNAVRSGVEWFLPFIVGFAITAGVVRPAARVACAGGLTSIEARAS